MKISVATLALNAGNTLDKVLNSVRWADEIVVFIDKNTTDDTKAIATKFTKNIFMVDHDDMFHKNRQKAIDKCSGDWILNIDSDEEVTPKLATEIKEVINSTTDSGFKIPRKSSIFGKWMSHTGWYPDYQLKLFRKGKGKLPCKSLHEDIVINGSIGTLTNDLLHHHYQSVAEFLEKLNRYTTDDAQMLSEKGDVVVWSDAIKFPVDEFLKRFFYWEGYKDGLHGLVLSLLQAMSRLVVFAKLWEKQGFKDDASSNFEEDVHKEFRKSFRDYYHWLIRSEKNPVRSSILKLFRRTII